MAAITKPSSPGWARVSPSYHKVRSRNVSPFSLKSQAYDWPGETWQFVFELPPLKDTTTAKAWITFLRDLAKADNYFVCNVSAYVPADVGPNLNLRLTSPDAAWDVDTAKLFGIKFSAEVDQ